MNLKQLAILEVVKDDQVFHLSMPVGSTYSMCIDACFKILEELHKMQGQAIEASRPQDPAELS